MSKTAPQGDGGRNGDGDWENERKKAITMNSKLRNVIFVLALLLTGCTPVASPSTSTPAPHPVTETPFPTETPSATVTLSPTLTPTLIPAGAPFQMPVDAISAENVKGLARIARLGRGFLEDLAWSPDGKLIAAASSTGIQVYDAQTLVEKYWIETNYLVETVAFSPDSALLASGGNDYAVHIWLAAEGTSLQTLHRSGADVIDLSFSPKAGILAEVSYSGVITLWRLADGVLLLTINHPKTRYLSASFSPDGSYLAAGLYGSFVILNASDGNLVRAVKLDGDEYLHAVDQVDYSPDGAILAPRESTGAISLWKASEGTLIRTVGQIGFGIAEFDELRFSPSGKVLAVNNNQKETVQILQVSDGKLLQEFPASAYASFDFSPNGDEVVIGTGGHEIQLWKVDTGDSIRVLEDNAAWSEHVAYSPDGKLLAASGGGGAGSIRLWQISNGALKILGKQGVSSLAFSPDGNILVSGWWSDNSVEYSLQAWLIPDGSLLSTYKENDRINCLSFSPDGTILAEGLWNGNIRIRQPTDWTLIRTLQGQHKSVNSIAFSPDGTLLASGSEDDMIRIWQVSDGKLLFTLQGHKKEILSLAFSPKEPLLASAALDGTVRLWSALTGERLRTIYTGAVYSVAFSPDGKLLAGGGSFSSVNIWQVDGGKLLKMLKFSTTSDAIHSVAFSPDGKLLAAGSQDETVWL
ncbi:MAG: WD40 repeat domain-containing protein, partial [Anaerolineales bacterium]